MASNAAFTNPLIENRREMGRDKQTDPRVAKNIGHD